MKVNITIIFSVITAVLISVAYAKPNLREEVFTVKAGGTLSLNSDSGSVEIESHSLDKVEVRVEKKGRSVEDFQLEFLQEDNDVKVSGKHDKSGFGGFTFGVRFIIKVPKNYNVDLRTGGGSIELSDLEGKVNAYTSGGSIKLGRIVGDVEVKTSGGSIRVDDVAGNINAHTSGGSIKATMSQQPTQDCRLTTSGGSVTATLLSPVSVNVEASTSGGSVSSEFDVDGTLKRSKVKGTINGGGPELYLKTSGGSVRIKKL